MRKRLLSIILAASLIGCESVRDENDPVIGEGNAYAPHGIEEVSQIDEFTILSYEIEETMKNFSLDYTLKLSAEKNEINLEYENIENINLNLKLPEYKTDDELNYERGLE